jgi:hypothetical protein
MHRLGDFPAEVNQSRVTDFMAAMQFQIRVLPLDLPLYYNPLSSGTDFRYHCRS